MFSSRIVIALGFALGFASPAFAGTIEISDAVAHVEHDAEHGDTLEIFMTIRNSGGRLDRIYAVRSKVAKKGQISGGIDEHAADGGHEDHKLATAVNLPAGQVTTLSEEGSHLELAELKSTPKAGDVVPLTLFFENAGPVKVEVTVSEEDH